MCNEVLDETIACTNCQKTFATKELIDAGAFFMVFNLRKQFEQLLSIPEVQEKLSNYFQHASVISESNYIGKKYLNLQKEYFDVTCIFNTDGAPAFKSSKFSLWPILVSVNELRYYLRKKFIIVAGLWFGQTKPNMKLYFQSVIKEMNNLSNPVSWFLKSGQRVTTKVHFIICTAYAVALAKFKATPNLMPNGVVIGAQTRESQSPVGAGIVVYIQMKLKAEPELMLPTEMHAWLQSFRKARLR